MSFSEYPNRRINHKWSLMKYWSSPLKEKSWSPLLSVSNPDFQVLLQTIRLNICPWMLLGMGQSSLVLSFEWTPQNTMNQQNLKTYVQQLLDKARHTHFPLGLIISQGHSSFECLFEAYSELWRKRMIEKKITTGKNSWPKNCCHQLLPCYLEVMQEEFFNGSTTGLCSHVQLSHNSLYASAHITPFHPTITYHNISTHVRICHNQIWFFLSWYDMIWDDVMWYDMIWYDMIWCDVMWCYVLWHIISYHTIS